MKLSKSGIIVTFIILLSFAVAVYFYPRMPEVMASHWNARGQVDGYTSKLWGLFLLPLVLTGMAILFILIPKIDPLRKNIAAFREYYNGLIVLFVLFLFYIYLLTIIWNLGTRFNMTQLLSPAFGVLFYYLGILLEKAKRNWFIGIRTPWTLSSDAVWDKTHRIGGKLFKLTGAVALLGVIFPDYAIFFTIIPVVLVAAFTLFYSYFVYQREVKKP